MKGTIITILISSLLIISCGEIPPELRSPPDKNDNQTEKIDTNNTLQFRFIDIGQGDATLIITPNHKAILIDAGTPEMGKERVVPLLTGLDIDLELIIASHYDTDHSGGITEVIKGPDGLINTGDDIIPVRGILDRGDPDIIDTTAISNYFIITAGLRYSLEPGDAILIDGVTLCILGQNGRFKDGSDLKLDPEYENAHSISLLITYKEISYLTSGDLPGPNFPNKYEPYDLEQFIPDLVDDIDVLHVSHHGSHNSTNAEFTQAMNPQLAIISVGENDYGHPHPKVIENLSDAGVEIYMTEGDWVEPVDGVHVMNGDICLKTNGLSMAVVGCEWDPVR